MLSTQLRHNFQTHARIEASHCHSSWNEEELPLQFLSIQDREERQDGGACEKDAWEGLEIERDVGKNLSGRTLDLSLLAETGRDRLLALLDAE
jgi:hypothetical protein